MELKVRDVREQVQILADGLFDHAVRLIEIMNRHEWNQTPECQQEVIALQGSAMIVSAAINALKTAVSFESNEYGVAVPVNGKPKLVEGRGPYEIKELAKRELAKKAMVLLAEAMSLSNPPGGIEIPGGRTNEQYDSQTRMYFCLGEMILGDETPAYEVLT